MDEDRKKMVQYQAQRAEAGFRQRMAQVRSAEKVPIGMQRAMARMSDDWFTRKVEPQSEKFYRLSSEPRRFLGQTLVEEFEEILGEIRSLNEEFTGVRISQVRFMLLGDSRVEEIHRRLRHWGDDYVQARLDRRNPKDGGHRHKQFFRIFRELTTELDRISWLEGTVHSACLSELSLYIPWCLYRAVIERAREAGYSPEDPKNDDDCFLPHFEKSTGVGLSWNREEDLGKVLEKVSASDPVEATDQKTILERLADLAADIQDMRPLLFRNFRSENVRLGVAPEVAISWAWSAGEGIGEVLVDRSPDALLKTLRTGAHQSKLFLRSDGRLGNLFLPWIEVGVNADLATLQANLKIVEAIHRRLIEFWVQIDREAILAAWRDRSSDLSEVEVEELEDAALASVVHQLAEEEAVELVQPSGEKAGPKRVPQIRALKLFAVLERYFDCEISSAKGSEKKIFRPGGKIYKLGWHEKNRVILTHQAKDILGRLGISVTDFLTVLTR